MAMKRPRAYRGTSSVVVLLHDSRNVQAGPTLWDLVGDPCPACLCVLCSHAGRRNRRPIDTVRVRVILCSHQRSHCIGARAHKGERRGAEGSREQECMCGTHAARRTHLHQYPQPINTVVMIACGREGREKHTRQATHFGIMVARILQNGKHRFEDHAIRHAPPDCGWHWLPTGAECRDTAENYYRAGRRKKGARRAERTTDIQETC